MKLIFMKQKYRFFSFPKISALKSIQITAKTHFQWEKCRQYNKILKYTISQKAQKIKNTQ